MNYLNQGEQRRIQPSEVLQINDESIINYEISYAEKEIVDDIGKTLNSSQDGLFMLYGALGTGKTSLMNRVKQPLLNKINLLDINVAASGLVNSDFYLNLLDKLNFILEDSVKPELVQQIRYQIIWLKLLFSGEVSLTLDQFSQLEESSSYEKIHETSTGVEFDRILATSLGIDFNAGIPKFGLLNPLTLVMKGKANVQLNTNKKITKREVEKNSLFRSKKNDNQESLKIINIISTETKIELISNVLGTLVQNKDISIIIDEVDKRNIEELQTFISYVKRWFEIPGLTIVLILDELKAIQLLNSPISSYVVQSWQVKARNLYEFRQLLIDEWIGEEWPLYARSNLLKNSEQLVGYYFLTKSANLRDIRNVFKWKHDPKKRLHMKNDAELRNLSLAFLMIIQSDEMRFFATYQLIHEFIRNILIRAHNMGGMTNEMFSQEIDSFVLEQDVRSNGIINKLILDVVKKLKSLTFNVDFSDNQIRYGKEDFPRWGANHATDEKLDDSEKHFEINAYVDECNNKDDMVYFTSNFFKQFSDSNVAMDYVHKSVLRAEKLDTIVPNDNMNQFNSDYTKLGGFPVILGFNPSQIGMRDEGLRERFIQYLPKTIWIHAIRILSDSNNGDRYDFLHAIWNESLGKVEIHPYLVDGVGYWHQKDIDRLVNELRTGKFSNEVTISFKLLESEIKESEYNAIWDGRKSIDYELLKKLLGK